MGIQFQGTFESLLRLRDVVLEGEEVHRQVVLVVGLVVCRWRSTIDQCLWLGLECPPGSAAERSDGEGGGDPPSGPQGTGLPSYRYLANLTRADPLVRVRHGRTRIERRARLVGFWNGN